MSMLTVDVGLDESHEYAMGISVGEIIQNVHGRKSGAVAATVDSSASYCYSHPITGGKQVVCESWRNLIAVGAKPIAITNCLNFGNPENKEIMGEFAECLDGIKEAPKWGVNPGSAAKSILQQAGKSIYKGSTGTDITKDVKNYANRAWQGIKDFATDFSNGTFMDYFILK